MAGRIYDTAAWKRLRLRKLDEAPFCEPCGRRGRAVTASHVDHKVAINAGGDPLPPLDGLMSMCPSCHSVKTQAKDNPHAFGGGGKLAFKGCDLAGLPIDGEHSFFAEEGIPPSEDGFRFGGHRPPSRTQS